MDILEVLAQSTRKRIEQDKKKIPFEVMKEKALDLGPADFSFEKALAKKDLSFICEVKKASPSKGLIAKDFDYLQIARDYEKAGADCLSVLTEPEYFLGSDEYLKEIAQTVNLPILRKDFTVDPYMIYQARVLGADAILLIVAILEDSQLQEYLQLADKLGLSTVVEAHDEKEIERAIQAGTRIIGVNNRNLKNFSVDVNNALSLSQKIPENVIFVSESGIQSAADIKNCVEAGADAVLIGETLMKAADKKKKLDELKNYEQA